MSGTDRSRLLVLMGWGVVVLVAISMLVFRGRPEMGPAIVFAVIGLSMGAWTWQRWNRAAMITSLALGVLWTLQFIAYAVAGAIGDEFEAEIFITDVIAVAGGVAITVGASQALVQRRRLGAKVEGSL
jgi:hypothetical protein